MAAGEAREHRCPRVVYVLLFLVAACCAGLAVFGGVGRLPDTAEVHFRGRTEPTPPPPSISPRPSPLPSLEPGSSPHPTPALPGRRSRLAQFQAKHDKARQGLTQLLPGLRAPSVPALHAAVSARGRTALQGWVGQCATDHPSCSCDLRCPPDAVELNALVALVPPPDATAPGSWTWQGFHYPRTAAAFHPAGATQAALPHCLAVVVCAASPRDTLSALGGALSSIGEAAAIGRLTVLSSPLWDPRPKEQREGLQPGEKLHAAQVDHIPSVLATKADLVEVQVWYPGHHEFTQVIPRFLRHSALRFVSSWRAGEAAIPDTAPAMAASLAAQPGEEAQVLLAMRGSLLTAWEANTTADILSPDVWTARPRQEALTVLLSTATPTIPGFRVFTHHAAAAAQLWAWAARDPGSWSAESVDSELGGQGQTPGESGGVLRLGSRYWRFPPSDRGFVSDEMFGGCASQCKAVFRTEGVVEGEGAVLVHGPRYKDAKPPILVYGAALSAPRLHGNMTRLPWAPYLPSTWVPEQPPVSLPLFYTLQLESGANHGEDSALDFPRRLQATWGPGAARTLTLSMVDGAAPYVDHAQMGFLYIPSALLDPGISPLTTGKSKILDPNTLSPTPVLSVIQNCMEKHSRIGIMKKLQAALKPHGYPEGIHHHGRCLRNIPTAEGSPVTVAMPASYPGWLYWGTTGGKKTIASNFKTAMAPLQCWFDAWKAKHKAWMGADSWRPCGTGTQEPCPALLPTEAASCEGAEKLESQLEATVMLSERDQLYTTLAMDQIIRGMYKLGIAMENSNCVHYVTEKPYVMLNGGAIPIVRSIRGVPAYPRHLPPGSYLDVAWFAAADGTLPDGYADALAATIALIDKEPSVFWMFHEWRRWWPWTARDLAMDSPPSERHTPPYLNAEPLMCMMAWDLALQGVQVAPASVADLLAPAVAACGGMTGVNCSVVLGALQVVGERVVAIGEVGVPDCAGAQGLFAARGQPEAFATTSGRAWCDVCDDMARGVGGGSVLSWEGGRLQVRGQVNLAPDAALSPQQTCVS